LAKEATGIDEQMKQFQRTSLNTVEVMNNINYVRLKTEKFAVYIFLDTIFKSNGLNISGVTSSAFMNDKLANIGIWAPALTSEAMSDRGKLCCVAL